MLACPVNWYVWGFLSLNICVAHLKESQLQRAALASLLLLSVGESFTQYGQFPRGFKSSDTCWIIVRSLSFVSSKRLDTWVHHLGPSGRGGKGLLPRMRFKPVTSQSWVLCLKTWSYHLTASNTIQKLCYYVHAEGYCSLAVTPITCQKNASQHFRIINCVEKSLFITKIKHAKMLFSFCNS